MTERERQLLAWIEENPLISQKELARRAGITRSSVAVHISNLMKKGFITGRGYVVQKNPYVVVVGAANIDIFGRPGGTLIPRDSNPGKVRLSMGGVGRNIAHNLTMLDVDVKLITAIGGDLYAEQIQKHCQELELDITHSLRLPGQVTSTYMFITNLQGEMELAISDMDIYEHLTPEYLETRLDFINKAALCIIDTNLPEQSIRYLAENVSVPLFADTVSATKAVRLGDVLGRLHSIKTNRLEASLLSGIEIVDDATLEQAADRLLELGIDRVFVTLGENGVYCVSREARHRLPTYEIEVRNTTGAGDSFMAALAWAHLQGCDLETSAKAGLAASCICIASLDTISSEISVENMLSLMGANGGHE